MSFADACYEAWRHGRNPDEISHDEYDRMQDSLIDREPDWDDFFKNYSEENIEEYLEK